MNCGFHVSRSVDVMTAHQRQLAIEGATFVVLLALAAFQAPSWGPIGVAIVIAIATAGVARVIEELTHFRGRLAQLVAGIGFVVAGVVGLATGAATLLAGLVIVVGVIAAVAAVLMSRRERAASAK